MRFKKLVAAGALAIAGALAVAGVAVASGGNGGSATKQAVTQATDPVSVQDGGGSTTAETNEAAEANEKEDADEPGDDDGPGENEANDSEVSE